MADILARIDGMASTGSTPPEQAPPPIAPPVIPSPPGPPPAIPPPAIPGGTGLEDIGDRGGVAPTRRPRGRILATIGGLFAVLLGLGGKLLLGLAVVGVGGQVLSSLFGGPFDKLPQSTRDGFEQRLDAALGPDASSLSSADYESRYNAMLIDGLPRLGDPPLVNEVVYLDEMFDRADTSTCAEAARSEFGSTGSTFELSDKMWAGLSQDELVAHIDTQVSAIEASARKAPDQQTVGQAQAEPAVERIFGSLSSTQSATLDDLANGVAQTDEDACAAARAFHDAEAHLAPSDLALVARYVASP